MRSPEASPGGRLPLVEAGLLVLVALACLVFQLRLPGRLPTNEDDQRVADVLREQGQPGDVVLLNPWWAERARLFIPDGMPVVGYQGDETDPLDAHPRIWVLEQPGVPGHQGAEFEKAFSPGRTADGEPKTLGHYRLSRFINGHHRPRTFSLGAALARAQVSIEGPRGPLACQAQGDRHRCPNGSEVATEWHEIHFQPRRCTKLFPPGGPAKARIHFPSVPGGDELLVRGGLIWDREARKEPQDTPVTLTVLVDGQQHAQLVFPVGELGLKLARGGPVRDGATLDVTSESVSAELRELCLEVDVVRAK